MACRGYVTADAGYSRGLTSPHATRDPSDIRQDEAHAQFNKLDASTTLQLPLPPVAGGAVLAWRAQLTGQWTNVALFGSEQIYAGGMSTVRGFREGVIAGDRGAYLRNELAWANAPVVAGIRIEPLSLSRRRRGPVRGHPPVASRGWRRGRRSPVGPVGRPDAKRRTAGRRATGPTREPRPQADRLAGHAELDLPRNPNHATDSLPPRCRRRSGIRPSCCPRRNGQWRDDFRCRHRRGSKGGWPARHAPVARGDQAAIDRRASCSGRKPARTRRWKPARRCRPSCGRPATRS